MKPRLPVSLFLLLAATPVAAPAQIASREVNVTSDSASGWIPSEALERQALDTLRTYFAAWDGGKADQAYAMMTPANRQMMPFAEFDKTTAVFHAVSGALISRRVLKVTWTKDPPNSPEPGIYVAIDEAPRYVGASRQCGYVVLFQPPGGGPFQVMRTENNFLSDANAAKMAPGQADSAWAAASANCPNYTAGS